MRARHAPKVCPPWSANGDQDHDDDDDDDDRDSQSVTEAHATAMSCTRRGQRTGNEVQPFRVSLLVSVASTWRAEELLLLHPAAAAALDSFAILWASLVGVFTTFSKYTQTGSASCCSSASFSCRRQALKMVIPSLQEQRLAEAEAHGRQIKQLALRARAGQV